MLAASLFSFLISAANGQSCSVAVGGQNYDLSQLASQGNGGIVDAGAPASEVGMYKYQVSFCADKVLCQGNTGNLVRLRDSGLYSCLGIYGKWASAENKKTTDGYEASFTSTEYCSDNFSKKYTAKFNYICNSDVGILGALNATKTGQDTCEYQIDIETNLVCKGSHDSGGGGHHPGGKGGSSGGLSGGSIFLIILVSLLGAYLIVGSGFGYKKMRDGGTTTVDDEDGEATTTPGTFEFPGKDLWCTKLPFWIKTGCIVSWISTLKCYRWTLSKIFKVKEGDEAMADALIEESDA